MSLIDAILGRRLASDEAGGQRIGTATGVPIFGLDALSSAAYGPEAALTVLLPLGAAGLTFILPITVAIAILLGIIYISYRQTIAAYPSGGGSYTVARANLGTNASLLAAAALMTDYVLNVAVGISAGIGALISAIPALQPYTLMLCLVVLTLLTFVNMRGVGEAGTLFMLPTCAFILTLGAVVFWGVLATISAGGHPHPVVSPAHLAKATEAAGAWVLLRAFASGCTAMTGVEAVSNGVQAFREPVVPAARRTLTIIIVILMVLLLGIAYLAHAYRIGATEPGTSQYQSVLSQLIGAVAGRGIFYWVSIVSILLVLCLSANTSFADFPRLCRAVAEDGYLPRSFGNQGRRLVYSEGIWLLAILSGVLLLVFDGVTDRLIPLFAVGAFLAFTLSQSGMVAHWWKKPGRGARASMAVNGLGAAATAVTVVVVATVKFMAGAWMVVILVPSLVVVMLAVGRHYRKIDRETAAPGNLKLDNLQEPIVIVPIIEWSSIAESALRFAMTLSREVEVLHIESEDSSNSLKRVWPSRVEEPARAAKQTVPRLTVLKSPFRFVVQPIIDHVLEIERQNPDRTIAVLLPELVERHWYQYFLHNQRAQTIAARLLTQGTHRIVIVKVPWYLR
ncbi:MAG: APC family permease [Candidatus Binatus sp.]|jgi:amino acid transporter|uniref:APC family permease n=1 Tax=Candidatus Binatus sp. TaxID=2811406 RepID=UPI003D14D188